MYHFTKWKDKRFFLIFVYRRKEETKWRRQGRRLSSLMSYIVDMTLLLLSHFSRV